MANAGRPAVGDGRGQAGDAARGRLEPVIELEGVSRVYYTGGTDLYALRQIDLRIDRGEMVAIVGPSGSGKSTLMNVLGCLDRPTAGRYQLTGRDVGSLEDDDLARLRNRTIGFVFQNYGLLPRLSAEENVELPLIYAGAKPRQRQQAAREALERVGLGDRLRHLPSQLSGGQQQRVAVARALAGRPDLLLADEPTGNLDSRSGQDVLNLIRSLNEEGMTVVLVTHDRDIASRCRREVRIRDGCIEGDEVVEPHAPAEGGADRAGRPPASEPALATGSPHGEATA